MATWEKIIENELTGEQALIKSNDYITFQNRLEKKREIWDRKNKKILSKQEAEEKTQKALDLISKYENILKATLEVDDRLDWEEIIQNHPYEEPDIEEYKMKLAVYGGLNYLPIIKNFDFVRKASEKKLKEQKIKLEESKKDNKVKLETYKKKVKKWKTKYEHLKKDYEKHLSSAVEEYFNLVLERSDYPEGLDLVYELFYQEEEKLIIVDVELPLPKDIPNIIEYKYIQSRDEIVSKEMKVNDFKKLYKDVIYQILLRTIHEIDESDYANTVSLIVINGKVEKVNKKTGKEGVIHIASAQVSKEEFKDINLNKVNPGECFRYLKGVTAGELIELSPIKPIMKVNRKDDRIVKADSVVDQITDKSNLATMAWQDFEILVRDLIEKEFSREGCSVEVTRASRDAGVDAIAFDEDPIRGGKYVIQAKRYNNLVPVSAVRDLYGTVVNEGAVKGILITTSYYGKDSLQFVKDKPLKLINGEELLHMFQEHGYDFKIELKKKARRASRNNY